MPITTVLVRGVGPDRVRSDTASVLEISPGHLLITYHGYAPGPEGHGDFGAAKIYLRSSGDGGLTWGPERMVADIDPGDLNVMSPYLAMVGEEILLGYTRNHSKADTSMHLRRSVDGGATFAAPGPIWDHAGEYRLQGGASSLVVLSSGRLLVPYQSTPEVWVPHENEYVGSYYSDDSGRSWSLSRNSIRLPLRGCMEPSVAEMVDGSLLMSLRTQLGAVFLAESRDSGETWSRARTSGLRSPESCTCLRRLPDSESVVLFWNDAEYVADLHHYGVRTPLSAARSDDGGTTWRKIGDIASGQESFTNLGCTFLADGTAYLTYLGHSNVEVHDGVYRGYPATKKERHAATRFELKAALISRGWFDTP